VWTVLVAAPWIVIVAVAGTVYYDDGDASLWIIGEFFVMVHDGMGRAGRRRETRPGPELGGEWDRARP
jgi:hypothetical protein